MNVLFIESQKKGKIRTCLHFHLPTNLASYPLTWYNDEEISVPPWPSRVWTGERVGGLGRERSVGGGHDLGILRRLRGILSSGGAPLRTVAMLRSDLGRDFYLSTSTFIL